MAKKHNKKTCVIEVESDDESFSENFKIESKQRQCPLAFLESRDPSPVGSLDEMETCPVNVIKATRISPVSFSRNGQCEVVVQKKKPCFVQRRSPITVIEKEKLPRRSIVVVNRKNKSPVVFNNGRISPVIVEKRKTCGLCPLLSNKRSSVVIKKENLCSLNAVGKKPTVVRRNNRSRVNVFGKEKACRLTRRSPITVIEKSSQCPVKLAQKSPCCPVKFLKNQTSPVIKLVDSKKAPAVYVQRKSPCASATKTCLKPNSNQVVLVNNRPSCISPCSVGTQQRFHCAISPKFAHKSCSTPACNSQNQFVSNEPGKCLAAEKYREEVLQFIEKVKKDQEKMSTRFADSTTSIPDSISSACSKPASKNKTFKFNIEARRKHSNAPTNCAAIQADLDQNPLTGTFTFLTPTQNRKLYQNNSASSPLRSSNSMVQTETYVSSVNVPQGDRQSSIVQTTETMTTASSDQQNLKNATASYSRHSLSSDGSRKLEQPPISPLSQRKVKDILFELKNRDRSSLDCLADVIARGKDLKNTSKGLLVENEDVALQSKKPPSTTLPTVTFSPNLPSSNNNNNIDLVSDFSMSSTTTTGDSIFKKFTRKRTKNQAQPLPRAPTMITPPQPPPYLTYRPQIRPMMMQPPFMMQTSRLPTFATQLPYTSPMSQVQQPSRPGIITQQVPQLYKAPVTQPQQSSIVTKPNFEEIKPSKDRKVKDILKHQRNRLRSSLDSLVESIAKGKGLKHTSRGIESVESEVETQKVTKNKKDEISAATTTTKSGLTESTKTLQNETSRQKISSISDGLNRNASTTQKNSSEGTNLNATSTPKSSIDETDLDPTTLWKTSGTSVADTISLGSLKSEVATARKEEALTVEENVKLLPSLNDMTRSFESGKTPVPPSESVYSGDAQPGSEPITIDSEAGPITPDAATSDLGTSAQATLMSATTVATTTGISGDGIKSDRISKNPSETSQKKNDITPKTSNTVFKNSSKTQNTNSATKSNSSATKTTSVLSQRKSDLTQKTSSTPQKKSSITLMNSNSAQKKGDITRNTSSTTQKMGDIRQKASGTTQKKNDISLENSLNQLSSETKLKNNSKAEFASFIKDENADPQGSSRALPIDPELDVPSKKKRRRSTINKHRKEPLASPEEMENLRALAADAISNQEINAQQSADGVKSLNESANEETGSSPKADIEKSALKKGRKDTGARVSFKEEKKKKKKLFGKVNGGSIDTGLKRTNAEDKGDTTKGKKSKKTK